MKYLVIDPMPRTTVVSLYGVSEAGTGDDPVRLCRLSLENPESYNSRLMFHSLMNRIMTRAGTRTLDDISVVAYRLIYGSDTEQAVMTLDQTTLENIGSTVRFSPIHIPAFLSVVRLFMRFLGRARHIAFSETGFFNGLPEEQKYYALPAEITEKYGIKRSGFHGIFHGHAASVSGSAHSRVLSVCLDRKITVCAAKDCKPLAVSFGFTPLEGLMGETNSGDMDAGLLFYLMEKEGLSASALDDILKNRSGFYAVTGRKSGLDVLFRLYRKNKSVRLAFDALKHRLILYLGKYFGLMNGADSLVFGGCYARPLFPFIYRILKEMSFLGIDPGPAGSPGPGTDTNEITEKKSSIRAFLDHMDFLDIIAAGCRYLV
jgi:acetate kinase